MSGVVQLLDQAATAAWDSRSRALAISAARSVIADAPRPDARTALTLWADAAGLDGPVEDLVAYLTERYRDRGDIALSLMRAAVLAELAGGGSVTPTIGSMCTRHGRKD